MKNIELYYYCEELNPGWYAQLYEDGVLINDSMKITFPIDLDLFDEDEKDELEKTLIAEFPGAKLTFN